MAASIGAGSMWLSKRITTADDFGANWWTWWVGDLGGQLILAPLALALAGKRWTSVSVPRLIELFVLFALQALWFTGWRQSVRCLAVVSNR